MRNILLILTFLSCSVGARAAYLLIPMDESQTNHLRAYGIAWNALDHETDVQWLLNYRGGSYLFEYSKEDEQACLEKGVLFQTLPDAQAKSVLRDVRKGQNNTAAVEMQRAPKIGVYSPGRSEQWDDAVVNVLTYAGIPFEVIYDKEVLQGDLSKYDWLHLHHEDFTGQHGRFYSGFGSTQWYKEEVATDEKTAAETGFSSVAAMKLAVALKMKMFVSNGGFLFAMCSATETFDVALAANGTDISGYIFDGDGPDTDYASRLNFDNCLAFRNFTVNTNSYAYKMSNIDTYNTRMSRGVTESNDWFTLSAFDVKTQPVQSMLVQNHVTSVKGFWGATTAFDLAVIRPDVDILAQNSAAHEARYIHGNLGKGRWTFYGGHDPEDYQHRIGEAAPDITQFPNSPGYRLILNNVMFQSIKSEEETHVQFSAYPSPATTQLTVNYTLNEEVSGVLKIYDASGRLSYSEVLGSGTSSTTVDVSGFSTGSYLWSVESEGRVLYTERFAVAK